MTTTYKTRVLTRVVVRTLALSIGCAIAGGLAAQGLKTGERIYREACFACHNKGVAKAPKFGDRQAWAPLIKEGQPVLTARAWVGVRGMPPRGGEPDLSLEEFSRAVAYMARAGGGHWEDPDAAMLARIRAEEKKRLENPGAK